MRSTQRETKTWHFGKIKVEWSPHIKSYATEANLRKAIEAEPNWAEHDDRYLVVRTPEGRWTAVVILDKSVGGYIGRYPFLKV